MLRLLISLLALSFVAKAHAESVCVSYFAAQGFTSKQCNEALRVFNGVERPCMSILWKTFDIPGRSLCAQRFLHKFRDKAHTLQIHFSNESARRTGRLYPYEFAPGLNVARYNRALANQSRAVLKRIHARALSITEFIGDFANSNSTIILSTGLEDNYTNKAYRVLYREVKKTIPSHVLISRNPMGKNEKAFDIADADFIELHGLLPRFISNGAGCIANLDGHRIDFDGSDRRELREGVLELPQVHSWVARYRKRQCLVFLWWPGAQGRGEARFVEPRRRNFRIYRSDINAMNKIIRSFEP